MGRIKERLIHMLGGYTPRDRAWAMRDDHAARRIEAPRPLHPRMIKAAYSYYVEPETEEVRRTQEQVAAKALAEKLALELLDQGMIGLFKQIDPVQPAEHSKRYRMTATVWALDATQMPMYGGEPS